MSFRFGWVIPWAAAAALCAQTADAQSPRPTAEKSTATLTMTIELKGGGADRPASKERNVTWTIADRYTVTTTMMAEKPSGYGALHKPDAAEQAREAERARATEQAAAAMQPVMAQAEQIMKRCGEDEACIQRETMKMAQGINPNSPDMQAARSNMAKASVMPAVRYQLFGNATQSGTFAIEETAHEAYYDAACSPATEATCGVDTVVRGQGDITDQSGRKTGPSGAMAEIDYQAGTLMLNLAVPGPVKAAKTVNSRNPHVKTGTTEAARFIKLDDIATGPIKVACGACETASGVIEKDVTDQFLGRPAKLVIRWSFKRSG